VEGGTCRLCIFIVDKEQITIIAVGDVIKMVPSSHLVRGGEPATAISLLFYPHSVEVLLQHNHDRTKMMVASSGVIKNICAISWESSRVGAPKLFPLRINARQLPHSDLCHCSQQRKLGNNHHICFPRHDSWKNISRTTATV